MFNVLNMSSTPPHEAEQPQSDDRSTRAKIRDAALSLFGEQGFRETTVRQIAQRAGVSPGLVVHHFGSKDGLRDAVDDHLADGIRNDKFATITGSMAMDAEASRQALVEHEAAFAYLSRALTEGTEVGTHLYDRLLGDAVDYLRAAEVAGLIHPTKDPVARAAALLNAGLAQTLLRHHLQRVLGVEEVDALLRVSAPMLDVYTDGLFTDSRIRDQWQPSSQEDS
jgi:AcrR family transcriptional regulator